MITDITNNIASEVIDFEIYLQGTLWTFVLKTDAAREWVATHVNVPDYMLTPGGFHADWRPARDITEALYAEGFGLQITR